MSPFSISARAEIIYKALSPCLRLGWILVRPARSLDPVGSPVKQLISLKAPLLTVPLPTVLLDLVQPDVVPAADVATVELRDRVVDLALVALPISRASEALFACCTIERAGRRIGARRRGFVEHSDRHFFRRAGGGLPLFARCAVEFAA